MSITPAGDGGFVAVGQTFDNETLRGAHGGYDGWIVKLDSAGSIEWQRACGGNKYDFLNCVMRLNDQEYVACGAATSHDHDLQPGGGYVDFWVVRFDSTGALSQSYGYGGEKGDTVQASSSAATAIVAAWGGGFVLAGKSCRQYCDVRVMRVSESGDSLWSVQLGSHRDDEARAVFRTHDNGYLIAGTSGWLDGDVHVSRGGGNADVWLIKLAPDPAAVAEPAIRPTDGLSVFPNPVSANVTLTFELSRAARVRYQILDELGRSLAAGNLDASSGAGFATIDIRSLAQGAYILRLASNAGVVTRLIHVIH